MAARARGQTFGDVLSVGWRASFTGTPGGGTHHTAGSQDQGYIEFYFEVRITLEFQFEEEYKLNEIQLFRSYVQKNYITILQ